MRRILVAIALLLWLGLPFGDLARAGARADEPRPPTVVLISLDGTRPQDVTGQTLPSLVALAKRGVQAEALVPPFPSNTFPGHVSMVTGVAPERHGIVNNDFIDPELGRFDKKRITEFVQIEPIWSLLDRAGIVSASYYWVGSEGKWRNGRGPRHWFPFSSRTPEREKAAQILAWLDLEDPAERPRLITSWFRGGDRAGHIHGPGTEEVREALVEQEPAIAALLAGIEERGLRESTTVIFVSDHGMAPKDREVDLRATLEDADIDAEVIGIGGFAQVYLEHPERDAARAVESVRTTGLEAWPRGEAPAELRLGNRRFGDVVVVAPVGSTIQATGLRRLRNEGFHGFRPSDPRMGALLIAAGPGIEPGSRLGRVQAADVAPTVLAILGVEAPEWMEGRVIPELVPPDRGAAPIPADSVRDSEGADVR